MGQICNVFMLCQNDPWSTDNYPNSPLCKVNNKVYGMTMGSSATTGSLYSFDLSTSVFTNELWLGYLLFTWSGQDYGVIQAYNGKLYGAGPGASNYGNIIQYDITLDTGTIVYVFDTLVGSNPSGGLVEGLGNKLYGVCNYGGSYHHGNLYSYDIGSNVYSALHEFDGVNGFMPYGSLLPVNDSLLFGFTWRGGTYDSGVFYSYNINSNIYTVLHNYQYSYYPSNLLLANNGKIYGLESLGGIYNYGTIFSYDLTTNNYSIIHDFDSVNGGNPINLLQASDGKLYGSAGLGGTYNHGVLFSYDINTNNYSVNRNFSPSDCGAISSFLEISSSSACAASFTLTPDTALHHYIVYNTATGTGPLHYYWSWGDNTSDTIPYPSHTYADTGFYTICLTIMDSTGCSSSTCDSSYHVLRTTNTMAYVNVIQGFTGIKNIPSQPFTVSVYPNPAKYTLSIHQSSTSPNELLIITDILGHEVYKAPLTGIDNTIELTKWSNGVYFYEVKGSGLQIPTSIRGKFIKQ